MITAAPSLIAHRVESAVAAFYDVTRDELLQRGHSQEITKRRFVLFSLLYMRTVNYTMHWIAKHYLYDHTSILNAIERVERDLHLWNDREDIAALLDRAAP